MVDSKNQIKRTFYIRDDQDIAIKIRAAQEHIKPSDTVQKALDAYLGLGVEKKSKK
jgi:hypothetical protein